ncbi:MAG: DUF2062 domain-containing protein [Bacteroidetes bacterium]|nr:DUF2062 domain-containing protein [Bacteroidota bacterium]
MPISPTYQTRFDALKTAVLIPTYNNASALAGVIEGVLGFTSNVIVVNDGSSDGTREVLEKFPGLRCIHFPENVGKGWALRKGFEAAVEAGYSYVITLDSDGQHAAKDLPAFLDEIEKNPDAIIIGARNMQQTDVPGKSSFGHKFSNFWFRVETGIKAPDTQSGYRLYPVQRLKAMHWFTKKYEFEIEVIVRAAWKGIAINFVNIDVYYPPAEKRITHFRPFQDFSRISVLNTFLVIIAFLYIKPRDFIRALFDRKKMKTFFDEHIHSRHQSDELKAISVAFGVFMGIIPIWGFQLVTAIFLAILFRLNKAIVIVAANISIPPMIPLIIFLSYKMGHFALGEKAVDMAFTADITLDSIKLHGEQYIVGSILLAFVAAAVFGILSYLLIKIFKRSTHLAG